MSLAQIVFLCAILISNVYSHAHTAYSQDTDIGGGNEDWMRNLCDSAKIHRLSLPGTHDTMADESSICSIAQDITLTQTLSLPNQLKAGIRVFDIRCAISTTAEFDIYHGICYLNTVFYNVLNDIKTFLNAHPKEFVIMRISKERSSDDSATFKSIFENVYYNNPLYSSYFYKPKTHFGNIPSVRSVRGKIVILDNFGGGFGFEYGGSLFDIQDDFNLGSNWDLYSKWEKVKSKLNVAQNTPYNNKFIINYLSGSGGSFPYFVASGHSSWGSGSSRLSTGCVTPACNNYPDFPRIDCLGALCTIAFEGTNILAYDYMVNYDRVGIIMTDFPGKGLVDRIINRNWRNNNTLCANDECDWTSYLGKYSDLQNTFGCDLGSAQTHYVTLGKNENRDCKFCNWGCYLARYPDLQAAFGSNYVAAAQHYNTFGRNENRDCQCNNCNFQCYLSNYKDLYNAFGCNVQSATSHWYNFGINENRNCRCVEE